MRAGLYALALAGCATIGRGETGAFVASELALAADASTTLAGHPWDPSSPFMENNPVMGAAPSPGVVVGYFAFAMACDALVHAWAPRWLAATIHAGVALQEGHSAIGNWQVER